MSRLFVLALLLCAVASKGRAEPEQAPVEVRKLVIAPFKGKAGQDARSIVLEQIAGRTDRTDFTVIGHDDVEVVAKRLGVAPESDKGRGAIGTELGVELWLDGELDDGGEGELRLRTSAGRQLAALKLDGRNAADAMAQLHEKLWPWIGALLSEQERIARKLQAEKQRALEKLAAREEELARQKHIVLEHEQQRMRKLEAARALARSKRAARDEELAHQVEIVHERQLAAAREEQRQREELERKQAEQQRQLALEEQRKQAAEQAALEAAAKASEPPPPSSATWQPPTQQWAQQPQPAPAYGQGAPAQWQPRPAPAYGPQPAAQWPQPQPAAAWQRPPAFAGGGYQPQASAPALQPAAGPGAAPTDASEIDGISPETREWLLRKQRERAGAAGAPN